MAYLGNMWAFNTKISMVTLHHTLEKGDNSILHAVIAWLLGPMHTFPTHNGACECIRIPRCCMCVVSSPCPVYFIFAGHTAPPVHANHVRITSIITLIASSTEQFSVTGPATWNNFSQELQHIRCS